MILGLITLKNPMNMFVYHTTLPTTIEVQINGDPKALITTNSQIFTIQGGDFFFPRLFQYWG